MTSTKPKALPVILIITALFFFISCNKSYVEDAITLDNDEVTSLVRSDIEPESEEFEVTQEMALMFVKSFKDKKKIISSDTYYYEGVPTLYIINFEIGWMAIPTDTRVQPILGESDVDSIYPDSIDNNGVQAWLDVSSEYVFRVKNGLTLNYNEEAVQLWEKIRDNMGESGELPRFYKPTNADWVRFTTVSTNTVNTANQQHLLQTKWGQDSLWNCTLPYDPNLYVDYNITCPFLTGCVPTAIAQVLYFFHNETGYPNDFYNNIDGYVSQYLGLWGGSYKYKIGINRSPQTPVANSSRWINMPLTLNGNGNFSYVSDLMMEIGNRLNATYSITATSASLVSYTDVAPCGITANSYFYSYNTVRSNIVNRKPVLVTAFNGNGVGHSWVIDGCVDITTMTTTTSTYYRYQEGEMYDPGAVFLTDEEVLSVYPNAYDGMVIVTNNTVENKYLLMNFGYSGNHDDGHYSIQPSGSDWLGYTNTVSIIYNIVTGQLN